MSAWQRRECRASATTPVEGDECRDVTGGMCESACRAGKRFLVSGLRCLVSKATRDRFAQVVPTAAVSSSSGGFERLPLPLSIYINIHIKIAFSRFALETEAGLPPCPSENVILVSTGGCLSLESGARTFVVSYNSECVVLPAWGKGGGDRAGKLFMLPPPCGVDLGLSSHGREHHSLVISKLIFSVICSIAFEFPIGAFLVQRRCWLTVSFSACAQQYISTLAGSSA